MSGEETTPHRKILKALNHPLRRRILRALHGRGEVRSPSQLGKVLRVPVSNVSYHVRVLRDTGVVTLVSTRAVRGSSEHFYASVLTDNPMAVQLLEAKAAEDPVP